MAWIHLIIAGLLEIVWAVGLKHTAGWTRLWPSVVTAACMILSFVFLSSAVRSLPIGTAYAVWTGIGTMGTVIYGIVFLREPADAIRLVCILLIVSGIVGLKLLTKSNV
jgi:quaternary ammonium compound-resistance protein SugE